MTDFRQLSAQLWASPQISPDDVATARAQGFTRIVNNRPDDEDHGQPSGAAIESAARAAGMGYCTIPISHGGFSADQVEAMATVLREDGQVLAYCRSGTRSTLLWALARASLGDDPVQLAQAAAAAGYDLAPIAPALTMLSTRAKPPAQ